MLRIIGLFLLATSALAKHEVYDGHSLYKVVPNHENQVGIIDFLEEHYNLDVWTHAHASRPGYVLVPQETKTVFEENLKLAGINFEIEIENIKDALEQEEQMLNNKKMNRSFNASRAGGLTFDQIYSYEEIDDYIEYLGRTYPETVTVVNAGNSFEGRPIKYLKISTTNFQDDSKPVVYMQSLLHAREWITQSATLYAIHKLVIDVTENEFLNHIDWIILPMANPDGFAWSQGSTRLWRKNRATGYMVGNVCMGVDLNRNFADMWSQHSSNSPCSDTFHGSRGFSESETDIVNQIIQENIDRMELFLDIHSFGSWMLYGYGDGTLPANGLIVHLVGIQMAAAIDAHKLSNYPNYIVGNSALLLYAASGTASDYAQRAGIPLSYTYEMPAAVPGTSSALGFLVNPDFIEQAGFETWQGIKAGAAYARNSYRTRKGL